MPESETTAEKPPEEPAPKPVPVSLTRVVRGRRERVIETRLSDRTITQRSDGKVETRLDSVPGGLVVSTYPKRRKAR
jgi:hypothetical protein